MIFMGIDPGIDGYIALIDLQGKVKKLYTDFAIDIGKRGKRGKRAVNNQHNFQRMNRVLGNVVDGCNKYNYKLTAILEAQLALPNQASTSTAKTFRGFGAWEMALIGHRINYKLIFPVTWSRIMLKGVKGFDTKDKSRFLATQMYPDLDFHRKSIDHNKSDALLLAEYLRMEFIKENK